MGRYNFSSRRIKVTESFSLAVLLKRGEAKLTDRDKHRLSGVHPDLIQVIFLAAELTDEPFMVVEGSRSLDRQKEYVERGVSKTLKSKHLKQSDGFGHAVDLCGVVKTTSFSNKVLSNISVAVLEAAKRLQVPIEWGGSWKTFVDMPHYQINL